MVSKTEKIKIEQGYVANPVPNTCVNCKHYLFEMKLPAWMRESNENFLANGRRPPYGESCKNESNRRCGIGKFAIKKSATCKLFEPKEQ